MLEERTQRERALLSTMNVLEGWVDTVDHKRRLYAMGAFQEDTLPSWKSTLAFDDARYWEKRPTSDEEKRIDGTRTSLWEREMDARRARGAATTPTKKKKKKRGGIVGGRVTQERILMDNIEDEEAQLLFSSWWHQSFGRVKFSPRFTLERFDPSRWSNLVSYKAILALVTPTKDVTDEASAVLDKEQVRLLRNWLCGRTGTVGEDPPLRIRHSGDHLKGNGLFCDDPRGIPPGAFIMPFDGLIASHADLFGNVPGEQGGVGVDPDDPYDPSDTVYLGMDERTGEPIYVAPGFSTNPRDIEPGSSGTQGIPRAKSHLGRFLNGAVSKKISNCAIVKWIVGGQTQLWIVNVYARTIQPGEELLWTYDNSGIDFFKQIGLYSQSAGFIYPPGKFYDYQGTTQMTIETDDPAHVVHDPAMKFMETRKEPGKEARVKKAMLLQRLEEDDEEDEDDDEGELGAEEVTPEEMEREKRQGAKESAREERRRAREEEEEVQLAESSVRGRLEAYDLKHEEDVVRLGLVHHLYSGVPVVTERGTGFQSDLGVADVPRLDFYLDEEMNFGRLMEATTEDGRGRPRTTPEIQQSMPYVSESGRQSWKIRAVLKKKKDRVRPDKTLTTQYEKIQWQRRNLLYYGVPVPRMVLPNVFVVPTFEKLSKRYGETTRSHHR
jgi:hypothetical protein